MTTLKCGSCVSVRRPSAEGAEIRGHAPPHYPGRIKIERGLTSHRGWLPSSVDYWKTCGSPTASHCPGPEPESSATICMVTFGSWGIATFHAHQSLRKGGGFKEAITLPVFAFRTFKERPV